MQSTHLTVIYPHPFTLAGYPHELPAGSYEVLVEEASISARGAASIGWTAAYLTLPGSDKKTGRRRRRPLNSVDLAAAMRHRRAPSTKSGEVALSQQKDSK